MEIIFPDNNSQIIIHKDCDFFYTYQVYDKITKKVVHFEYPFLVLKSWFYGVKKTGYSVKIGVQLYQYEYELFDYEVPYEYKMMFPEYFV